MGHLLERFPWLWTLIGLLVLILSGCHDDAPGRGGEDCDPEAPVCAPDCGEGAACERDCTCQPVACDPDNPVCPPCFDGQLCRADCTCGAPDPAPAPACDPEAPVCAPGCGEGLFCDRDCSCQPVACDADNPVCPGGCDPSLVCTPACVCAPGACDPDHPVCPGGCEGGQVCGADCACAAPSCDPTSPVCPGGCGEGEFCGADCTCVRPCDPEDPVCDPGCGEGEFCGPQCACLAREVCDAQAPRCDPPCPEGKICGPECACILPCDPQRPLCTPACSPLEICGVECACEPRPCDADNPVCPGGCDPGMVCSPQCLCEPPGACDPQDPQCDPACGQDEFCGRDCACHPEGLALPDLTVDVGALLGSVYIEQKEFGGNSCALIEGCVVEAGWRRLLRFSTMTPNIGTADLFMGDPRSTPELFEYSACHGHHHFNGYAEYRLVDEAERVVATGRKQAFCLLDSTRYIQGDPTVPGEGQYNCSNQGITRGWADIYGAGLDCQWVDITGVAPGRYRLEVSINNHRTIQELSFDNNRAAVHVIVPPIDPLGDCLLEPRARGAGRDCGWELAGSFECVPGEPVAVGCAQGGGCGLGSCEGDAVLRVCEGDEVACAAPEALGFSDDACGGTCPLVNFLCPGSGRYTVLQGAGRPGDAYTCQLDRQVGFVGADPTAPCVDEGAQGLNRDCGWEVLGALTCTPGDEVQVGCNAGDGCGLGSCEGDSMLRICPGHLNHCRAAEQVAANDDACGSLCSQATFTCPEVGAYTVLGAPFRARQEATCQIDTTASQHCHDDALEPNHDPGDPASLVAGTFDDLALCRDEREYYRIFATEVDTIDLRLSLTEPGAAIQMTLFDPNDAVVADVVGAAPVARLVHQVETGGAHRLRLRLLRGAETHYAVTLRLE